MRRGMWSVLALALVWGSMALADGIIIPSPVPGVPPPPVRWLSIVYHRVTVTIKDGQVTTHVDQAFRNDGNFPVEGTYVFPLPPGAVVQEFKLWVGGEPVQGEVLPADQAREIYLDFLRKNRDPALLEYVGRDAFRARIFPIAPGETRRVELEYMELLSPEAGLFQYRYPLSPERFSARPIDEVRIEIAIKATHPLASVYSPSHSLTIERPDALSANGLYVERHVLPEKDFLLYYAFAEETVGADLITYKVEKEDSWFLLLVTPRPPRDLAPLPKELVLVIDRSGSMEGEKIAQAKAAAEFILTRLGPEDRFGLIAFSDEVTLLTEGVAALSEARVDTAVKTIRTLSAEGGTNIYEALKKAMEWLRPSDRPQYVIFLTDGLPTSGVTATDTIVRDVTAANVAKARLFAFGVGYDVDTHLLDLLTQDNRGTTTYVKPGEDLERAIASFYTKIAEPALSDLSLKVEGVSIWDVYPSALPDLFHGTQLTVVGRYGGSGRATVMLTGRRGREEEAFVYERDFPELAEGATFLPRLWATRKIGHLLNRIRLEGEAEELVEQIIELGTRYGIATPYTAFLVREEERALMPPPAAYTLPTGPAAVGAAQATKALTEAEVMEEAGLTREVGGRVFLFIQGAWRESTYQEGTQTVDIEYMSDAYFALIELFPEVAPILALGDEVILQIGKTFVHIGPEGLTELPPKVITQLQG